VEGAQFVRDIKKVRQQVATVEEHQVQPPLAREPHRLTTYAVEIELIEKLKRIHDYSSQMLNMLFRNAKQIHKKQ